MFLSDTAIRKPVFTAMMISALIVFGTIGYLRMGVDLFPEVDFPVVTITTTLTGANAEIMDLDVTDVLENEINTIEGIDDLISISSEGVSQIVARFKLDKDIDVAAQDVREKVSVAQRDLPKDIDPPIIAKVDLSAQPIMWISVYGDAPYRQIANYAEKVLKERIQRVPGVGSIMLGGFQDRAVRVWLDGGKMEAHRVTAMDVIRALQEKNIELPGGLVESKTREFTVKTMGEFKSVAAFNDLVVASRNGAFIRLQDIGWVEDGMEDVRSIIRFNRKPAVGLAVRRQSGTNTVKVADDVKAELEKIKANLPKGINVEVSFDQSRFIRLSINQVQFELIYGATLCSLTILIFLRNFRPTFITLLAIPTSLIGALSLMYALGFTLNNLTMLAMVLAVGMVIDDTIVVQENTFRHIERGSEPMMAAQEGVGEIAFAVIAATLSIAAVFIPVAFMRGMIGRFFHEFGLTVVFAIMISMFVSLTLTPMLCSRFLQRQEKHGAIFNLFERAFTGLDHFYRLTLALALRHRGLVVLIALGAFAGGIFLTRFIGREFVPKQDEGRFIVRFETNQGSSVSNTERYMEALENYYSGLPEMEKFFFAIGLDQSKEVNRGIGFASLVDRKNRKRSQQELMRITRQKLAKMPGITGSVEDVSAVATQQRGTDIEFIIQGPDVDKMAGYSEAIMQRLRTLPGYVDIDSNFELTKPEVNVFIDRDLADDLGVDILAISTTINALIGGVDVTKYKEGGERYDVRVRLAEGFRNTPEDITRLLVRTPQGRLVRLENMVRVKEGAGPNLINRYNRQRSVTIYANLEGKPLGAAQEELERIARDILPKDGTYQFAFGGRGKIFRESFYYLFFALFLAVIITYMVLASQFESFIHPFTVMLSLPLTVVGAFGALLLWGDTLNIFSYIGIIMLMGIVTRNAILLVDYTNTLRARGMERNEAVLTAGPIRLRPILMTSLTVIATVIPTALALGEGGEARSSMARAVLGGMSTSTFLTLLVIPVVYTLFDDLAAWMKRRVSRHSGSQTPP